MVLSGRKRKVHGARRWVLYLVSVAVATFGFGCSRQTRYEVLTFFFTGVPPLEGEKAPSQSVSPEEGATKTAAVEQTVPEASRPMEKHPPFAEGNCDACHNPSEGNKLYKEPCFRCHKSFAATYKWVHGPAAVGFCNTCHEPHQSRNEFLLISKSTEICFKCHVKADIFSTPYHEKVRNRVCFDCHNPHGGPDRRFLKEGILPSQSGSSENRGLQEKDSAGQQ